MPLTNGYRTAGNKAVARLFVRMRAIRQKAMAICRERAQGTRTPPASFKSSPHVQPERNQMQNLSPRHVKTEEALRLGVMSGWYSTKASGTFVSGPHDSETDCLRKIAEINPPPAKRR
ncbi:MAG: hypothetical protein DME65_12080 [Verrucomicrobia bacterium]|nr:MAG: hypothetical protein DME65_12080 [Verrucomicrobiota bacterium]